MKKSIYFILSLLCIMSINFMTVSANDKSFSELFPNKPSLFNTKGYAESFNELTPELREEAAEFMTYEIEGEESSHLLNAFTGTAKYTSPYTGTAVYKHFRGEYELRAEFDFENINSEWVSKLSSNNTIHVRIVTLRNYTWTDENKEWKNEPGFFYNLMCMYGDKAEIWFLDRRENTSLLPPDEVEKRSNRKGVLHTDEVILSDDERGCVLYYPIVCVREDYMDFSYFSVDYDDLYLYVYYEDEDWLIPDKLQFKWEDIDKMVDIDDIKATSNFIQRFVDKGGVGSERRTKFEAIYDSVEYYDPFSDEKYEEKKKAENEKKDAEIKDEKEQEKKDKQEEVEKIPEEKNEPEKEPEPEIKEPEPTEATEPTEKTEPEEDNQEENVAVYLNGELLNFEQAPVVEQDRVLVPMRKIFEAMEAKVEWQQEDKTVFAEKNGRKVKLQIGNAILERDGEQIELDCLPQLVNDNTMIPIRAVAEALDANVVWNETSKAVVIEEK